MAISIINVVRNSLKFSTVNLLATVVGIPVGVYVATVVTPVEYGAYGFLGLWLTYAALVRPGLTISGYREIPVLIGKGKEEDALRVQNISITSDMLYTMLLFLIILGASFFFSEPLLKYGLVLTAVSCGVVQLVNYWIGINFLRQNFNIVVKGRLIATIVSSLVIIASVYWLKVYALLIAPIVVAIFSGIYYWKWGAINFCFTFDWKETVRLTKIGIILQAGAFAFWGFRLADRTIIASTLPLEQMGLYTFAIGLVTMILLIPNDFTNVLQPIIYKELGKSPTALEGLKDTKRIAIYMALGIAILIPVTQVGFYLIVSLITTKYIGSIPIFYVLSYNLYLASVVTVANIILDSSVVNKQRIALFVYIIGLALNIIFDLLAVRWGYGVIGIAWVTICTQGLVTFIVYYFARNYMCLNKADYFKFQIAILIPFLATVPFYFFHNYLGLAASNVWTFASISLGTQVVLWSLVIGIFYRDYLSIGNIRTIIKECGIGL